MGGYEERYRLTHAAKLALAASLLSLAIGLLAHGALPVLVTFGSPTVSHLPLRVAVRVSHRHTPRSRTTEGGPPAMRAGVSNPRPGTARTTG